MAQIYCCYDGTDQFRGVEPGERSACHGHRGLQGRIASFQLAEALDDLPM
uniref:Uncharacterized protein n=1 Tax=Musa acuminata subsp. malaccensis TaxID=214687 RepID=A0A804KRK9_MUSAM